MKPISQRVQSSQVRVEHKNIRNHHRGPSIVRFVPEMCGWHVPWSSEPTGLDRRRRSRPVRVDALWKAPPTALPVVFFRTLRLWMEVETCCLPLPVLLHPQKCWQKTTTCVQARSIHCIHWRCPGLGRGPPPSPRSDEGNQWL